MMRPGTSNTPYHHVMFGIARALLPVLLGLLLVCEASKATEVPVPALESISSFPESIVITGADRRQQVIVTGHFVDKIQRDLTSQAALHITDSHLAKVDSTGLLVPLANGSTTLHAELQGKSITIPLVVRGMDGDHPI